MAIPPFPSQDLAKLVLGYLVEEQLMTAYDEFLHSSPYLDAQRNEYDRIIMHSLRNILAEYRAVKIYVEACKPIALRKKLFQCTNLLEIVTFLVRHIDVNKLQPDGSSERVSIDSHDVTTSRLGCDACNSLRLGSCICTHRKKNVSLSKSQSFSNAGSTDAVESAQATSLSDLPGNQDPPEAKQVKVLERNTHQSTLNSELNHEAMTGSCSSLSHANIEQSRSLANLHIQPNPNNVMSTSAAHKTNVQTTSLECSQNIAEFNTVLNQVCNNSIVTGSQRDNNNIICAENVHNNKISTAGTFQDFTTGVGGIAKTNISVPDSSTSENINVLLPLPERENKTHKRSVKGAQKKKCVFRVGNVKHDFTEISNEVIDIDTADLPPNPKPDDQKVTILSDVRVGNDDRLVRLAPVLKNATSTPLYQMQTIFINGTPVYNPNPPERRCTFTRDEIMAMPTIILVPASGSSQTITSSSVQPQTIMAQSSSITTTACTLPSSIQPLTVDVTHSSNNLPNILNEPELSVQNTNGKPGLVKTVEASKNASVPKDCIIASSGSTSTPHMLPPKRKSSSTPRRTSHVRVLDFTTPKRNLNETINENPNLEGDPDNNEEEIILSKSTNLSYPHVSLADNTLNTQSIVEVKTSDTSTINLTVESKCVQKKPVQRKKSDWDADLRALAVASESIGKFESTPKPKPKQKHVRMVVEEEGLEKKQSHIASVEKTKKKSCVKNSTTPNTKKKKVKLNNEAKKLDNNIVTSDCSATTTTTSSSTTTTTTTSTTTTSTTISIHEKKITDITGIKEPDKIQNKSNDEERIDTPEIERLSLHNEIGVKLNISDILETPYKQALYDIQMETPRFLGPDLPDDPMSDIKIMNIPTPRFLSTNTPFTPKPAQATPSYSTRPTDYSSGGSYYKPDDQDYLPILEDMVCPVTSTHSKDNSKKTSADTSDLKEIQSKDKSRRNRSSRPIRQCAKNVSYYNSPMVHKTDDTGKKRDVSSCSDTISVNSSFDTESTATLRGDKSKQVTKSRNKKPPHLLKNRSPLKKVTQRPFMKIKPRRPTPNKDTSKKTNRKSLETTHHSLKEKSRNRSISKDNCAAATSLTKGQQQVVRPPTKSRRKSSTPRKLHCTKTFNCESSGHDFPEGEVKDNADKKIPNLSVACVQDSDTEQLPLRWSDDGSQDMKLQENRTVSTTTETDEISQIKEFINKSIPTTPSHKENEGCLHVDLVKRGFDVETAKIIERDLLNTPSHEETKIMPQLSSDEIRNSKLLERSVESDCSIVTNNLVIHEEDDSEDVEFSVHECNEDSDNYLVIQHDDNTKPSVCNVSQLKDKFSMEVCIDDGVVVRLRATPFNNLFDQDPQELSSFIQVNRETEIAVSSICNIDRLYTPLKDPMRDQCYKLFDSTLTSIDTPLKTESPKRKQDCTLSEIILEGEEVDERLKLKQKAENRKRKRSHCSSTSEESIINENKKVKPETQFILNSKDIKNLDIETLLSRLHGP